MIRIAILLLSVVLLFGFSRPMHAQQQVAWKKGKVKWRHFRLVKDDDDIFKANLSYVAEDVSDTLDNEVRIDFRIVIDKEQTWVKSGHLTRHLLIHEQAHFNIAVLELRRLKQQLSENPHLLHSYDSLLKAVKKQEDFVQKQFDRETAFGTNREKNKEWYKKTKKELRKLRSFQGPLVLKY